MKQELVFMLVLAVLNATDKFSDTTKVIQFTSESFKATEIGFKNIELPYLVMFYAPWCPHCKRLIQTWETLATQYESKLNVGAVDCTQHSDTCERFGVRGYPSLTYFTPDNQMIQYKGERTQEKLMEFIDGGYVHFDATKVPQKADKLMDIKNQLSQPSILIVLGVLSIFTIILVVVCALDVKESQKLNRMEKELNEKKKKALEEEQLPESKSTIQQSDLDEKLPESTLKDKID